MIIPGYTAFGSDVYLAGSSITVPGYTAFGSDVYLAGSNYNICGTAHSSGTYYKGNGSSVTGRGDSVKAIVYDGTLYEAGAAKTVIGSKPNQTLYYRDADGDKSYTLIGSKVYSQLYARDSSLDRSYTAIGSKPNQTLYYRDTDGDRTVACAGEACTVNMATINIKEVSVLSEQGG